jgi:hypothetical protein
MLVRDWLVLRVVAGNMFMPDGGAEGDGPDFEQSDGVLNSSA